MTLIRFLRADGTLDREVEAQPGAVLLHVAQDNGQPLEGACEGAMACSTCHVIVAAEDFDRLPRASEEEDDLLDLAAHVTRTSRLACQIELGGDLATLTVRMPGATHNWLGR
jgi:ferredoxin